jgi:hypothetical protein
VGVIRLELEVDREVYPELHAVLAAIGNGASRAERVRQLAATGLVWETVRIRGAAVLPTSTPAASPAPASIAPRRRVARRASPPADVPLLLDVVDAGPSILDAMADAMDPREDDRGEPMPQVALMHKPVARSRVLRMRDMGLFKNG